MRFHVPPALNRRASIVVGYEGDGPVRGAVLERGAVELPPGDVYIVRDFDHFRPMGLARVRRRGDELWADCRVGPGRTEGLFPALGIEVLAGVAQADEHGVLLPAHRVTRARVVCIGFCQLPNLDRRVGPLWEFQDGRLGPLADFTTGR